MLYKKGTEINANNLWSCDTIVAESDEEYAELQAEGWHPTPIDAHVPLKEQEKVIADIVKKSERIAKANAQVMASQGLDPTGSYRLDQ
jgi:hypothetical protein